MLIRLYYAGAKPLLMLATLHLLGVPGKETAQVVLDVKRQVGSLKAVLPLDHTSSEHGVFASERLL